MSNKQSSVKWLIDKLSNYDEEMVFLYDSEIKQAEAMHKEEVLNFQALLDKHEMDALNNNTILLTREEFYNETYKGGNK
jgi:hypothetical protein